MYHINKDKSYRLAWIVAIPLIVCMLLSGCSLGEKKIKIFSVEEPRAKLDLPMPEALDLEQIRWIIITSENAEEVFKKLEEAGIDPVLFGITDKDYQLLSKNFAQIRAKLQETNILLEEYKKYYEEYNTEDTKNE
tara:strand:- start:426 stop:830 length:405 start_codon:yes stop_codon:yes gene_type:complete